MLAGTMDPQQPRFAPHGSSRFALRGQILMLYSEGPFNAEHIVSLAPAFREVAAELAPQGPWVSLNIVSRSIMSTPDAIDALRRSAEVSRDQWGRIGAGYVAPADIEGRRLMEPKIRAACADILPTEFFETLEPGLAWAETLLAAARPA